MARSKASSKGKSKVVDDEEEALQEEVEEEEVQTKGQSRSKAADDEEVADDDDEAADEEEADPAEADEPAPDTKPVARKSKGKVTRTTMAFIVLNWIAMPTFVAFAYLDYTTRLQYSYRAVINYVAIWGLPLRSGEEDFPSVSNETRPNLRLTREQLRDAFKARKTGVSVTQEFVPVDEPVPLRLRAADMTTSLMRDIFRDLPEPVPTLEDEMIRLKKRVPDDIQRAADKALEKLKTDDEKRNLVRKILLTMPWRVHQVARLENKIAALKGSDLDNLVKESVQRRIYHDILAPLNVTEPGDLAKLPIEMLADLQEQGGDKKVPSNEFAYSLEDVKELLTKRLAAAIADDYDKDVHFGDVWIQAKTSTDAMKRDSVVKRRTVALIMFALANVNVPVLDEKLYPKGIERAQTVCGLHEFTSASIFYVQAWRMLKQRKADTIIHDRQGFVVMGDQPPALTGGYINRYNDHVDENVKQAESLHFEQQRLEDFKRKRDFSLKTYEQRAKQLEDVFEKLLAARKDTEKYIKELRIRQVEMHQALVELSDAQDRNIELEARIRRLELSYTQPAKGGKK